VSDTTFTFGTPPLYQTKKRGKMGMGPILPQKLSLLRFASQPLPIFLENGE
jgi:hypothetical protein